MKTIVTAVLLAITASTAYSQNLKESQLPATVVRNFHESFKDAQSITWEKKKGGHYAAEFKMNNSESSAIYAENGVLLKTETVVSKTELPASASTYIDKNYPGHSIAEVKRSIEPTGATFYETEIKKGKDELELIFDGNGIFLKQEMED